MSKELIDYFIKETNKQFGKIDSRFDKIDKRFDKSDSKIDGLANFKWKVVGFSTASFLILGFILKLM